ncbi:Hypothetical protein NTJ_02191 [Nesidiocoris tenuis]|uniref:Uncharacterized protein n=1 Tax=Nesidiocoris tenuis TaxID=355587 RepID=A0ABN7ADY8_9HEMI|nr:Hypothetical protein NTJ_02191 [Nesidiocoris tenuis]
MHHEVLGRKARQAQVGNLALGGLVFAAWSGEERGAGRPLILSELGGFSYLLRSTAGTIFRYWSPGLKAGPSGNFAGLSEARLLPWPVRRCVISLKTSSSYGPVSLLRRNKGRTRRAAIPRRRDGLSRPFRDCFMSHQTVIEEAGIYTGYTVGSRGYNVGSQTVRKIPRGKGAGRNLIAPGGL